MLKFVLISIIGGEKKHCYIIKRRPKQEHENCRDIFSPIVTIRRFDLWVRECCFVQL